MLHASNEATKRQIELAREQGEAQTHALEAMKEETGHAGQVRAGDYVIGYAVEEAEGLYRWRDGELEWEEPTHENAHVEVVVADAADGRFVPGLEVTVNIRAGADRDFGTYEQPLLWHPWLLHYGRNWTLPGDGTYDLRVHVEPLRMPRHDKKNGRRFAKPVDVTFRGVRIETGRKTS
jgi:hypothetical protein